MKKQLYLALKILSTLLMQSDRVAHVDNYEPLLYTERRAVRVVGRAGDRAETYAVARGDKWSHSSRTWQLRARVRDTLHRHWCRWRMRIAVNV